MLDLRELGERIQYVDQMIIDLVKKRMGLAQLVGARKAVTDDPIFRAEIEEDRLNNIGNYSRQKGLNPNFARALLYLLIDESCKTQLIQLQGGASANLLPSDPDERYKAMKANLIRLTEKVAPIYNALGDEEHPATSAYIEFESALIMQQAKRTVSHELAVDLGCATGRVTSMLANLFTRVVGFDISQHMVAEATARTGAGNVEFEQADLEEGIPLPDSSVDLTVMNLGTMSDVKNAKGVLREIERILIPGGRYLFSFYNAHAVINQLPFIPYETGLAAVIDSDEHCLTVTYGGEEFKLYARPYEWKDIELLLSSRMAFESMQTYPTIASILPRELLANSVAMKNIATVDCSMAWNGAGAYTVVYGEKKP